MARIDEGKPNYNGMSLLQFQKRMVLKNPEDRVKVLPWTHQIIANAKAVIAGPHRGVNNKHLQYYLSEICYRFNRRFWKGQTFHRLLRACVMAESIKRVDLLAHQLSGEQCQ